jgi:shikimate kinase
MQKKGIVLCGFMGAGKSKLGTLLAGLMGYRFEDLDQDIQRYEGMTILQLFERIGESGFRRLEQHYLSQKLHDRERVLSLGGGTLQTEDIVYDVCKQNLLIFVDTPFDEILQRISGNPKRPLVLDENGIPKPIDTLRLDLQGLFDSRRELYLKSHVIYRPDPAWSPLVSAINLKNIIESHSHVT